MAAQPLSLKELFLTALAVPPIHRANWLRQACGQDAELRQHVELMLAAHGKPHSLLDLPTQAGHPPDALGTEPSVTKSQRKIRGSRTEDGGSKRAQSLSILDPPLGGREIPAVKQLLTRNWCPLPPAEL